MSSVDKFFSQKSIDPTDQSGKQAKQQEAVKRKNPGSNKINKQLQARGEASVEMLGKPVELQQFQGQISQGHQFIQVRLNEDGSGYSLVNESNPADRVGNQIIFANPISGGEQTVFPQQQPLQEADKKTQVKKRRKKNELESGEGEKKSGSGVSAPQKTVQKLISDGNTQLAQQQPQQNFNQFNQGNPNLTSFSVMDNNSFNLNNNSNVLQQQQQSQIHQNNSLQYLQSQQYHQQQMQQQQQHQVKNSFKNFLNVLIICQNEKIYYLQS